MGARLVFASVSLVAVASLAPTRQPPAVTCPRIGEAERPALVYIEGTPDGGRLRIAHLEGGKLHRQSVTSATYLEVTQLDNTTFLLRATTARFSSTIYVLDAESGRVRRIEEGQRLWCLRAEPGRRKAMLVESDPNAGGDRLLELDLASLAITKGPVLSKAVVGDEYARIVRPFKISPDFSRIAYVSRKGAPAANRVGIFELKWMDLRTLKTTVIDDDVRVQIPGISSFEGRPPFQWTDNHHLLYQHMLVTGSRAPDLQRNSAQCVFEVADIRTGERVECLRKTFPLDLKGGSLDIEPVTGRLILNRIHVLDHVRATLSDINLPFAVSQEWGGRRTEIRAATGVLYDGPDEVLATRVSASGGSIAYLLRPGRAVLAADLYAVFRTGGRPILVASGDSGPTWPIAWIEGNTAERRRR